MAVHMFWEEPVGDSAAVEWTTPNGEVQSCTVDLSNVFDPQKPGRLSFEILQSDVRVTFHVIDEE